MLEIISNAGVVEGGPQPRIMKIVGDPRAVTIMVTGDFIASSHSLHFEALADTDDLAVR